MKRLAVFGALALFFTFSISFAAEMNFFSADPYEVIGLERSKIQSPKSIMDAYVSAMRKYTDQFAAAPDKDAVFQRIIQAYSSIRSQVAFQNKLPIWSNYHAFGIRDPQRPRAVTGEVIEARMRPAQVTQSYPPRHPKPQIAPEPIDHRLEGGKFTVLTTAMTTIGSLTGDQIGYQFFGTHPSPVMSTLVGIAIGLGASAFLGDALEGNKKTDWNGALNYRKFGSTGWRAGFNLGWKAAIVVGACNMIIGTLANARVNYQIKQFDQSHSSPSSIK